VRMLADGGGRHVRIQTARCAVAARLYEQVAASETHLHEQ
jgi:hypothetical protein